MRPRHMRAAHAGALRVGALVGSTIALFACAGHPAPIGVLTPERDRITDQAVVHDMSVFDALGAKLDSLRGGTSGTYREALARGWLTFAREEYADADRTPVVDQALAEATRQTQRLAQGDWRGAPDSMPPIAGGRRVREDLWQKVAELAADPGFGAAQREVALLQVELVRAGHVTPDGAACRADAHLAAAERLAREAEAKVIAGRPAPPPIATISEARPEAPPAPQPAPVAAPKGPDLEHLGGVVHFGFNSDSLTASSIQVLDHVASVLVRYPDVKIVLEGHTDLKGADAYNLALSERRAESVRRYLVAGGVVDERISSRAYGRTRLEVRGEDVRADALNRRVDLIFQATDKLRIDAVRQEGDLQPDSGVRPPKPAAPKARSFWLGTSQWAPVQRLKRRLTADRHVA